MRVSPYMGYENGCTVYGQAQVVEIFETVQKCPKGLFPFSHYKC